MDLGLDGRVALVIGGGSGLGRASALELLREGASVCIASRSGERLERAAAELGRLADERTPGSGPDPAAADDADIWLAQPQGRRAPAATRIAWAVADVSTADGPAAAVESTVARFGRLDILVVNAGGPPPGPFESITDAQWRAAMDTTFLSAVRLTGAALPHLRSDAVRAAGGGRIVFIISSSVKLPIRFLATSNAIRPGTLGLMKTLAVELAPDGILVNAVGPNRLNTERIQELDADTAQRTGRGVEEVRAGHIADIPLGRYGEPEELGAVVAFLCSRRASYVTGALVPIDGGYARTLL